MFNNQQNDRTTAQKAPIPSKTPQPVRRVNLSEDLIDFIDQ